MNIKKITEVPRLEPREQSEGEAGLKVKTHLKAGFGIATATQLNVRNLQIARPVALCG